MSHPDGCIYTAPTLQPCLAIEPEPDSGIRVGLDQRYAALTEPLPLTGGGAMRLGEQVALRTDAGRRSRDAVRRS